MFIHMYISKLFLLAIKVNYSLSHLPIFLKCNNTHDRVGPPPSHYTFHTEVEDTPTPRGVIIYLKVPYLFVYL